MRIHFPLLTVVALVSVTFLLEACNSENENMQEARESKALESASPASNAAIPNDGVRRVTVEELRRAMENGEAIVVDVRGRVEYELGHIKGAFSIPLGVVAGRANELPRDKLIVAYCA